MRAIAIEKLAWLTSMVGVFKAMPQAERDQLLTWERENLDGQSVGTSDWPGWEKYIGKMPQSDQAAEELNKTGYVYLLSSEVGLWKIGQSKNVDERVRNISTSSPVEISLAHTIWCDDRYLAERILHGRFEPNRERGEWFALSTEQIDDIRRMVRFETGHFVRTDEVS